KNTPQILNEADNKLPDVKKLLADYIKKDFYSPVGRNYSEFIISEYIKGVEYAVGTFSKDGEHYVSSVQKYVTKIHHGVPVILSFELENNKEIIAKVTEYAKIVLTKLAIRNGFASRIVAMSSCEPRSRSVATCTRDTR
nr:hypothetical protein [Bacillus pacificus]